MLHVYSIRDKDRQLFSHLFKNYCSELRRSIPLFDCPSPNGVSHFTFIDLIAENDEVCGFAIYQSGEFFGEDGWGNIREIYIVPSYRKKGLGKFLLYSVEMKLTMIGAKSAYCLPIKEAVPFFENSGYVDSGKQCDEGCNFYIKSNLKNGCHNE